MLAQLEIQEQERPGRSALLLDDPAAELDGENLARLMDWCVMFRRNCGSRLSSRSIADLIEGGRVFHVKHGEIRRS